jgi:2-polyprenyl-3-methyl-5-hydroxy-6-metoxy-1,4-benzoquinol methylase
MSTTTICPACHSPRVRRAFHAPPESFLRCRDCLTLFDIDPASPEDLRQRYQGSEYFVKDADDNGQAVWGYEDDYLADREFSDAKFDRVIAHLERYVQPGRLLDVGAGPGFLVAAAERRGWDAIGLDLNEWAAEYARGLGVDVRAGELSDHQFEPESFDAVTMLDVVEHVSNPDELLEEAARIVRPGGALALLTPDAGSPVSRLAGHRWPEVQRPDEHMVLFSVRGLAAALTRHGFVASGWHSIGKTAPVATLVADVSRIAPRWSTRLRNALAERPIGKRVVEFDPRTKFVLYARRLPDPSRPPAHRPARVPRHPEQLAQVDAAILDELGTMADARRLCAWMFDGFAPYVPGARVLEVGAGIGTFTQLMLDADAKFVHVLEPEPVCADVLERTFAAEAKTLVAMEGLPDAPSLEGTDGTFDLAVCQNVLEHIGDDRGALAAMARALRPGGRLALVVPADPRLFGALDDAYGHWRRYTSDDLGSLIDAAGLEVESLQPINALGIAGWWAKNRRPGARIGANSFRAYEALVGAWRPIEERLRPPLGLSIFCLARKPE